MHLPHPQTDATEARRAQAIRAELATLVARAMPSDGRSEPLGGLFLSRSALPGRPAYSVTDPSFCVVVQGSKEIFVGRERYPYDPERYLLTTFELPVVSQVLDAAPDRPYLGVRMRLDPSVVGAVLMEAQIPLPASSDVKAVATGPLDVSLLDAVLRLVRLLDEPAEARLLAPLVTREIIVRLLLRPQGARLRHIGALGGAAHPIAKAVDLLSKSITAPLRIERIAQELGMSVSGFHHQFKAVTALSPLQYHKRLRLQEARRLLLSERLDAASAGARVGYDDAAHFSREYKSLFGLPPVRDVERLREAASTRAPYEIASGHGSE